MTEEPEADIAVVGAGPAGTVTALLLARRGWTVVVLDRARFPRAKACGECVNPGAVARLEALGLGARALGIDPMPLRGWELGSPGVPPHPAPFPAGVGVGWGIERAVLDHALVGAARRAGVEVREGVRVDGVDVAGPGPPTLTTSDGPVRARLVVGADGLRSRVARAVATVAPGTALPRISQTARVRGVDLPDDRGRLVLDRDATVGVAPVAPGRWNVTRVVPAGPGAAVARSPEQLVVAAAAAVPELGAALADGPLRASGPFHWRVSRPADRGVVLVGDAAGYFDPLTGQGIHRAVASAEAAADTIHRALLAVTVPERRHLAAYGPRIRRSRRPGRRLQGWIEGLLDHPRILEAVLRRLARAGTLSDVVAVTGDARPLRSLLSLRHLRPRSLPSGWPP